MISNKKRTKSPKSLELEPKNRNQSHTHHHVVRIAFLFSFFSQKPGINKRHHPLSLSFARKGGEKEKKLAKEYSKVQVKQGQELNRHAPYLHLVGGMGEREGGEKKGRA